LKFFNHTPFPALAYRALDSHEQIFHVVTLRTTSKIVVGGTLRFTPEQDPLAVTDVCHGALNKSSVRQESDLAPFKPKCDVIVIGKAWAPMGSPARRFAAGIRISGPSRQQAPRPRPRGLNPAMAPPAEALATWEREMEARRSEPVKGPVILDKRLVVCGPRFWEKRAFGGWALTQPEPIACLPLQYEYAYGGECRIELDDPAGRRVKPEHRLTAKQRREHPDGPERAPLAHRACETNPTGMGFAEKWYLKAKKLKRLRAPQIESPGDPVREFGRACPAQGFGVVTKAWLPRRRLCGTVDEAFVQSGKPLPADFDFSFWNGAHPDLQVPWLNGDEDITLTNLCPHNTPGATRDKDGNTLLRFALPGHQPYVLVRYADGTIIPAWAELDTLVLEPDVCKVTCVYRLRLPVMPAVRVMEARCIFKGREEPCYPDLSGNGRTTGSKVHTGENRRAGYGG
jgi:hypothetical protein